MQRLIEQNINTKEEYDRIFKVRAEKDVDEFDQMRWKRLLKYYQKGKLIDLGCLDSLIPQMAKEMHPRSEIWGMDHAAEAVAEMQNKNPSIFYHVGDIHNTKFPKHYFDYVVLGEVLEHMEEPEKVIKEALRILQKKAILAISVPYNEAREPGAVDKDRHLWSFTEEDFVKMAQPYKCEFEILGSQLNPYKYHFPNLLVWIRKK